MATLYRARVIATYNLHLLVGFNSIPLIIQSKIGFVGYMRTLSNDKPLDTPKFNVGYFYNSVNHILNCGIQQICNKFLPTIPAIKRANYLHSIVAC